MSVIFLAVASACSQPSQQHWGSSIEEACPNDPKPLLVPPETFPLAPWESVDLRGRRAYSRLLAEMEEPSLWCGMPAGLEAYRFMWIRTFDHPIAVRISRVGNRYALSAVVISGTGQVQTEPRQIVRRISKQLTRRQWEGITSTLERVGISEMTTNIEDVLGNDGAIWTIEMRRTGRYHLVERWGGADGIQDVGKRFLILAGLPHEQIY